MFPEAGLPGRKLHTLFTMRTERRFRSSLLSVFQALTDLFFPRSCVVCGRRLKRHEQHLCLDCDLDLPLTYFWAQERNVMADKFNALIQNRLDRNWEDRSKEGESVRGLRRAPRRTAAEDGHVVGYVLYARAAALFYYNSQAGYRHIPQALKYEGAIALGRYFARRLGMLFAHSPLYRDVSLVVPVPLHRGRQWKRGYNQAAVIAREIATALRVPCDENLLYRRRRTRTQTRLTVEEKTANVDGAFAVRSARLLPPASVHILLVDDVFTTGATLESCHAALRQAWKEHGFHPCRLRISIATLAFVGKP